MIGVRRCWCGVAAGWSRKGWFAGMTRVNWLRRAVVAVLALAAVGGCAGCSAVPDAADDAPATTAAVPQFQIGWLPVTTATPPVPQSVPWQGPDGASGYMAEALTVSSPHPTMTVRVTIVSAGTYPDGYWQGIATSPSWKHDSVKGKQVAVSLNATATAITEERGYIIQVQATGADENDLLNIVNGIRWR